MSDVMEVKPEVKPEVSQELPRKRSNGSAG